jgi:hydroxyacylglutathione hydrolase
MPEIAGAGTRRVGSVPGGATVEPVADGVWLVRGRGAVLARRVFNVYLIEEPGNGGVTVFDTGTRDMLGAIKAAAEELGGIKRVVLGHAHEDHRGCAARLGAPVFCHPDEKQYAEHPLKPNTPYYDTSKIEKAPFRLTLPRLMRAWDGGPVEVAGTLDEGDEVAGFEVLHVPGHAPGQIALLRDSDGLALTTDVFFTLDLLSYTAASSPPRLPHPAFTPDMEKARESIRRLAEIEPTSCWPGHADPVVGDVRAQLERAAAG